MSDREGFPTGVEPLLADDSPIETASFEPLTVEPSPVEVARVKRRRAGRFVLGALGLVGALVVGSVGYAFWLYATTGRLNEIGSKQLDPQSGPKVGRPGKTVATLAAPVGESIAEPTADTVASVTVDETSPIPPPGTPNTVAGLPGPNTGTPAVDDTFPAAEPLPGLDVNGLDPSTTVDTLPPLVTIPEAQVVNKPLVDISQVEALGGPNTINILMAGTDSRDNVPENQATGFGKGKVRGSRTDTIMVLRIDPDAKKAWVLSLPRDLFVRMPGTNSFDRINAASARSDRLLVAAIRENLDIPIHHMMKVDFGGFQRVVAAVGGVNICFDKPARDKVTQLNVTVAGCQRLNPTQATAYVRSRRYEELQPNGKWKADPRGDLGRIARQQLFIRNGMTAAIGKGFRNPITLNAALKNLRSAIAFDKTLGFTEVLSLANKVRSFDPQSLATFTVPTKRARIDGKEVLQIDPKTAADVIGQFGRL